MKTRNEVSYTDEPKGEGWNYNESQTLTPEEQTALELPTPKQARGMRLVRRPAKLTRINIRLAEETLSGLKARAADIGMPYQTLAASVLHMVATGKLNLALVPSGKK